MTEIPVRFPPPLARSQMTPEGRVPIIEDPVIECGAQVRLSGVLAQCIRATGHPVAYNFGHSNGCEEWNFEAAK